MQVSLVQVRAVVVHEEAEKERKIEVYMNSRPFAFLKIHVFRSAYLRGIEMW